MSLNYTREKLYSAVEILASSNESIQDRLHSAYINALIRLHEPNDFPEELREEFNEINKRLTEIQATSNEGSVQATTTKMSEEEAGNVAEKIVTLYDQIARKLGAMESQTILSV
ncbi:hypothetical protein VB711_08620 [Cronbergia sp. UHCC 0137]|uniref:hypothetical protein n=1 Tax=Cronbergia sp. UHCC 0137 TaxID=3110239 RepID=UPI002B1F451B|nr:hypothetical protein [Cronbergia sp. UHCC 0137]MEA5617900.1 hypothetical protein [Cronbergia sp. UHCC 0137]